jgi:hypothetical protein
MFNIVKAYNVSGQIFIDKEDAVTKMIQNAIKSVITFNECKHIVLNRKEIIRILKAMDEEETE